MISKRSYEKLKNEYGNISSWTIWEPPTHNAKSDTSNIDFFENNDIYNKLNNKYVFVGLNASSTHGIQESKPWINFHSSYRYQNDYKLRYALMNTKFWGSYITDIIKYYPEVDSTKVMNYLKQHNDVVENNIGEFKKEMAILSNDKPIIIAVGNDSFNILNQYLSNEYKIVKIPHYSMHISKEDYRTRVLEKLSNIEKNMK